MKLRRIAADLPIVSRQFTRNPIGLFFSLVFPIILIGLFGLIFQNTGNNSVNLPVLLLDHSNESSSFLDALNATGLVNVQIWNNVSASEFSSKLYAAEAPVGLVIPPGFGAGVAAHTSINVTLYTDPGNPAASGTVYAAVNSAVTQLNFRAAGAHPVIGVHALTVGSKSFAYIDYLIPGLIGFAILTSPMFSMVELVSTYRKDGFFRQLSLTPLTRAEWLSSRILWYIGLTLVSAALMLLVGIEGFGAKVNIPLAMLPFLFVGPFLFVSLGMLAGSVAKSPETAAVIGNVVTFPMMFLSGTFFPTSTFSPPLLAIAKVLPLYYVIDGLNSVMLFGNSTRALTDFGIVLVISVVIFLAAIVTFKWREE
ncbi:MAG: ABC transporter permease [Thermoplasmata archaeon]|nr:ABC transporter permease [Thermoplasmata archaeon]MCI4340853.1 ABC transporter permease [Thermoplasmata archaeon]